MARPFDVEDVQHRPPSWPVLIKRGLRRRCPRCGGGDVFHSRWRLKQRCPTCGYRFWRESGFALGAWFINFMFLELIHWSGAMGYIVWRSGHPSASLWPPVLVAIAVGIVVPIVTYPWSQTLWAAIELAMTPIELPEIVDAMDALGDDEDGPGADARTDRRRPGPPGTWPPGLRRPQGPEWGPAPGERPDQDRPGQ